MNNENKKPLVSVILPTYNRATFVKRTIESVLNQTYDNLEILVIDDGSSDETERVVKGIDHNQVIYIKNKVNQGIQKSLNTGIKSAKGKYLARIDDQDIWLDEQKLEKQVQFMEKHKDYVLTGTGVIFVNTDGVEIYRYLHPQTDLELRKSLLSKNHFTHSSVLLRKEAVIKIGGYGENELLRHVEDYDLWLKMGMIGKMYNFPTYSVSYVVDEKGLSGQNRIEQIKKNLELVHKYKNNYPHYYKSVVRFYFRLIVYGYLKLFFLSKFTASIANKKYKNYA